MEPQQLENTKLTGKGLNSAIGDNKEVCPVSIHLDNHQLKINVDKDCEVSHVELQNIYGQTVTKEKDFDDPFRIQIETQKLPVGIYRAIIFNNDITLKEETVIKSNLS